MHTRQTSRRYARAWFDLARERGVLAAADADALALEQVWREVPEFAAFCGNYQLHPARRRELIATIFGKRVAPLTLRFLSLLESRRRLDRLADILDEFRRLSERAAGVLRATVTTAVETDEALRTAVIEALQRRTGARGVRIDWKVDAGLIAGAQALVGDTWVDVSVAGRLARMRRAVSGS